MTELVGVSRTLSAIPGSPAYSTSAMTPVVNPSAHNARSSHYKIGSPMELLSPSCNGTSGHAVVDSVFLYGGIVLLAMWHLSVDCFRFELRRNLHVSTSLGPQATRRAIEV